jgi:dihydroorotate dehydrogenase (NAD+) catalytic subunit
MAQPDLTTKLGPLELRTPLIAASGTVGSVWEWAGVADVSVYGAAVAKSVSPEPWTGRDEPRLAPTSAGMLNGIGIQNPGIVAWQEAFAQHSDSVEVPVWGSAVAHQPEGFATVARGLEDSGVIAIEANLSCPNLEDGVMFSFDAAAAGGVIAGMRSSVSVPIGAKLSPNSPDIVAVARACREAGADFIVLTNTAFGFGIDTETRRPRLSGGIGGYSGIGLKPVALRCVYEIATGLPGFPIVGCGGVATGDDVVEYLMAGASAVAAGTVHLAEPKAGRRIEKELCKRLDDLGTSTVTDLIGAVKPW